MAENYGWQPLTLRMNYLFASSVHVTDDDAKNIHNALERLFEKALADPLAVYPVNVDMGELYLLKEFISGGAFTIR